MFSLLLKDLISDFYLDLFVYRLRFSFINVSNGLKYGMKKLKHLLNPKALNYISAINI